MSRVISGCVVFGGLIAGLAGTLAWGAYAPAAPTEPMIGHMVFFTLKESTPENRRQLTDACNKYLDQHEGVVYFSAGTIGKEFNRPVNDQDWDVALHLVFKNKAAHDKYQDHERHLKFIEENKASWNKVRVFDSLITGK